MAFNPTVASNGIPVTPEDANEVFLLSRAGISFSVEAKETGKFSGSGTLFLTSHSIFFVAKKITVWHMGKYWQTRQETAIRPQI